MKDCRAESTISNKIKNKTNISFINVAKIK